IGKPTHSIALNRAPRLPEGGEAISFLPPLPSAGSEAPEAVSASKSALVGKSEPLTPSALSTGIKQGSRLEFVVEVADGRRGTLVTGKRPSVGNAVLVEFDGKAEEILCQQLRLIEVR